MQIYSLDPNRPFSSPSLSLSPSLLARVHTRTHEGCRCSSHRFPIGLLLLSDEVRTLSPNLGRLVQIPFGECLKGPFYSVLLFGCARGFGRLAFCRTGRSFSGRWALYGSGRRLLLQVLWLRAGPIRVLLGGWLRRVSWRSWFRRPGLGFALLFLFLAVGVGSRWWIGT